MADPTDADAEAHATREVSFSVSLRGYDRQQVDEYVRELRLHADRQAEALREAEQRLTDLGADVSVPLPAVGSGGIGARVERIVALAEAEAREIRAQAERDVARMRADMEDEADQARRFREKAAKASAEESRKMIARAEEEVARVHETRDALLAQLAEIGETIDEITGRFEEQTAPQPRRALDETTVESDADAESGTESEAEEAESDAESEFYDEPEYEDESEEKEEAGAVSG